MLCCGLCSQWQHIACHDRADLHAGKPRRNWDQVEFICRQCQARRVASKNSGYYPQHAVPNSYLPQPPPVVPSTSYPPYGTVPPISAAHPPQDYPRSYPVAVNGAAAYMQPNMGTSRQPPVNYHQQMQQQQHQPAPPPPRLSAGPSYASTSTHQQYRGAYDQPPAPFQHNVNGHRAPAYQVKDLVHLSDASLIDSFSVQ